MKFRHFLSLFFMVLNLFFSIWAKCEIVGALGYLLIASTALVCGSFIYYIQKDIRKE